jgi:coproporphyrinogen III oxidase-like Fe-S oxidoreductase
MAYKVDTIVRLSVTAWINLAAIAHIETNPTSQVTTVFFIGGTKANFIGEEAQKILKEVPVSF